MVDILHRVGVKAPLKDVYQALATREGVAGWWTKKTTGESRVGGELEFRFGAAGEHGFRMRVTELAPEQRVSWHVVDGPPEWVGTTIGFDLKQEGDYAVVLFKHQGWPAPVEFMHHCSTKWAIFLMSLKSLVESGTGSPEPYDTKIDNWN
ncbi:MAG: SRPBCC domain-containing protein [Gemmatimonadota bacterium]